MNDFIPAADPAFRFLATPPLARDAQVRIQLGASGSPIGIAGNIVKQEGFFTLYRGLSAGLLRQATYTTARLGIFKTITEEAKKMNEGKPLPLWQKAVCGLTAGGLGSLVGSPADLALIRMQADGTLPVDQRRNYRNAFTSGTVSASQDRFLLTPITSNETDNNPYTWWVPLSFTTPSGGFDVTKPQAWLDPANADTTTDSQKATDAYY